MAKSNSFFQILTKKPWTAALAIGIVLAASYMGMITSYQPTSPTKEPWQTSEEIVVLTRNAPSIFYYDKDGIRRGFEYELASIFVKEHLGRRPKFRVLHSTSEVLDALTRKEGDFAAAGLTKLISRESKILFGPSYASVEQQVICREKMGIKRVEDLIGKEVVVVSQSSYAEQLSRLSKKLPGLDFKIASHKNTEDILSEVFLGKIDCTITDSHIFELLRSDYPDLKRVLTLGQSGFLAFAAPKDRSGLIKEMNQWFESFSKTSRFQGLKDQYFSHTESFDYYDIMVFRKRVKQRLPRYLPLIKEASLASGFSKRLLAAVSYQESHWNPKSKSPTGVRGFMMLTLPTAQSLGVKNRLNAKESMLAGAKFLRQLYERLPDYLNHEDRVHFALTAYNMGYSHLTDARKLCISLGYNPNTWLGLQKVLPLLSKKKYYQKLRFGFARGYEALSYVQRIKSYRSILENHWPTPPTAEEMALEPPTAQDSSH